jgi:hypothetical protein
MALMIFTVTPDKGEEFEVEGTSRDMARWERMGRGNTLTALQQNPSIDVTYTLCWIAMERLAGQTDDEGNPRLVLPEGVTDKPSLLELCDVVARPAAGLEGLASAAGGGVYPPVR